MSDKQNMDDLRRQNELLVTRLRRVTLENLIHDNHDFPVSISVLSEYLSFPFCSDYLLLAVLHKRPNPLLRPPTVRTSDGRPVVQYPPEAIETSEALLQTYLLPKTQFITFRAEMDIGILLNPNLGYLSEASLAYGMYYEELIQLLEQFTSHFNRQTGTENMLTLSTLYQGNVSIRRMYLEAKTTFDYSWDKSGFVQTFSGLHIPPLLPEEQHVKNALEQEFLGNVNHLLFLEAAIVLDQILEIQFMRKEPLEDIIVAAAARLRNVVAAAEVLTGIGQKQLSVVTDMVVKVAQSASIPELQDRIHDFFALISEITPQQPVKKSQQVLEFIESNYSNPALSAQMICDRFRISRSYLSKILQEETGCGLVARIHDIRVQHAKQLLSETAMQIDQVAVQVGFSNRFGLLRAFRKIEGCSPSEYRQATHTASS